MNTILLLGPSGQVGWELQRSLAPLGAVTAVDEAQLNFKEPDALGAFVRENAPDMIVNAAAYTNVDKAESDAATATAVNATAVGVLAAEAARARAFLVHYSTDYVFDGEKPGPYTEDDEPAPISVYGRTKLQSERAIQASGCRHLIFRTSWVYGLHGRNFPKTVLRLAAERDHLTIVSDQVGAPTSAELLADVTALCAGLLVREPARYPGGIYHVTAAGSASWFEYAKYLVRAALKRGLPLQLSEEGIRPVSSREYASSARRPLNSRLSTDKIQAVFGLQMPHWTTHLDRFMAELPEPVRQ